jgi:nucleotide-binding universal stress UspA family protein
METTHLIVVGVDGSDGSMLALRWSVAEAAFRDAELVLVNTWHFVYAGDLVVAAADAMEEASRQILEEAKTEATTLGATVADTVSACGGAAEALLDASKGADLLVVGSRGRGGFGALLLGSTSQQCVHHATCPVVVIPASWRPTD